MKDEWFVIIFMDVNHFEGELQLQWWTWEYETQLTLVQLSVSDSGSGHETFDCNAKERRRIFRKKLRSL